MASKYVIDDCTGWDRMWNLWVSFPLRNFVLAAYLYTARARKIACQNAISKCICIYGIRITRSDHAVFVGDRVHFCWSAFKQDTGSLSYGLEITTTLDRNLGGQIRLNVIVLLHIYNSMWAEAQCETPAARVAKQKGQHGVFQTHTMLVSSDLLNYPNLWIFCQWQAHLNRYNRAVISTTDILSDTHTQTSRKGHKNLLTYTCVPPVVPTLQQQEAPRYFWVRNVFWTCSETTVSTLKLQRYR